VVLYLAGRVPVWPVCKRLAQLKESSWWHPLKRSRGHNPMHVLLAARHAPLWACGSWSALPRAELSKDAVKAATCAARLALTAGRARSVPVSVRGGARGCGDIQVIRGGASNTIKPWQACACQYGATQLFNAGESADPCTSQRALDSKEGLSYVMAAAACNGT